ncbi:MAG: hypothetical protein EBR23_02055 [Planctomycetia bacterium]|nr:hypothetical protein [Planctomycetia bacterium]
MAMGCTMSRLRWMSGTAALVLVALAVTGAGEARAQGARAGASTPFSQTYRRPAVSPYMMLQQQGYNPMQTQNIYQTQVLPQVQQQQQQITMLDQSRKLGRLQSQVQQVQRDTTSRQVDESIRPTGHRATYLNYSHFYPASR